MKSFNVSVFLERAAHQLADKFCQSQVNAQKAEQIYHNTLAVYAVSTYLKRLGFETDLAAGDSWDPAMQTCLNVADLIVKECGRLECRPVLPGSESMHSPVEVWNDRIGYVAVQLNEDLDEATLLGFVERVADEELLLNQLRSLTDLSDYLDQMHKSQSVKSQPVQELTRLALWFHHQIDPVWQTVEELFGFQANELVFGFRSASRSTGETHKDTTDAVCRGKKLDLGLQRGADQVALLVAVQPTELPEVEVSMKIYSVNNQVLLPQDLTMTVLGAGGEQIMQSQAGSESLEFQFNAEMGERFSLQVEIDNFSIIEEFIV